MAVKVIPIKIPLIAFHWTIEKQMIWKHHKYSLFCLYSIRFNSQLALRMHETNSSFVRYAQKMHACILHEAVQKWNDATATTKQLTDVFECILLMFFILIWIFVNGLQYFHEFTINVHATLLVFASTIPIEFQCWFCFLIKIYFCMWRKKKEKKLKFNQKIWRMCIDDDEKNRWILFDSTNTDSVAWIKIGVCLALFWFFFSKKKVWKFSVKNNTYIETFARNKILWCFRKKDK